MAPRIGSRSVSPGEISVSEESSGTAPSQRPDVRARQRTTHSLAAHGQRSASPAGVAQRENSSPGRAAEPAQVPTVWEDYTVMSAAMVDRFNNDMQRRALTQHGPSAWPVEIAARLGAGPNAGNAALIEAQQFYANTMPEHFAPVVEAAGGQSLQILLAALPFTPSGENLHSSRRVFEQARLVFHELHRLGNSTLLRECIGIANHAVFVSAVEEGFADIRQAVLAHVGPWSPLGRLERERPMTPVGLVHLRSRFGYRAPGTMTAHVPAPNERSGGYWYLSLTAAEATDLYQRAADRAVVRQLVTTPGHSEYGQLMDWSVADRAAQRWARALPGLGLLRGTVLAEEFGSNVLDPSLIRALEMHSKGEALLTLFAGLPFLVHGRPASQQRDLFIHARQMADELTRVPNEVFEDCATLATEVGASLESLTQCFIEMSERLEMAGMPAPGASSMMLSGAPLMFGEAVLTAAHLRPQTQYLQTNAVDDARRRWAPGAPSITRADVEGFLSSILPNGLLDTLGDIEGGHQLMALFAGIRMTEQCLDPVTLRMTTDQAQQALHDLQRYASLPLLELCVGISSEVACADSLQHCFTQIRTALVSHAASLSDGQLASIFATLRPSFNQDVVEKMAIEFSHESGRLPQEAIEYYVQLIGEVRKHVPLVDAAAGHTWGNLDLYRIEDAELAATAARIVTRIDEQTTPQDPHFLDFFASHPAWQKRLKAPPYADEYQAVITARDRASDTFNELSPEQQSNPENLARMSNAANAEDDWFKTKTGVLLAELIAALGVTPR